MKITDETLSAFLDNELSAQEMDSVRARIAEDENLANRLAELAAADTIVRDTYSSIDDQPMPAAITDMIAKAAGKPEIAETASAQKTEQKKSTASAKILRLPSFGRQHLAMAASIAFAVGFGLSQLLDTQQAQVNASWQTLANALDTTPSGTAFALGKESTVTPQVTFTNAQGLVCRQYQVQTPQNNTHAVACRGAYEWHQVAAMTTERTDAAALYQTASADNPINRVVDQMAVGPFLNHSQEAQAIANDWQLSNTPNSSNQ